MKLRPGQIFRIARLVIRGIVVALHEVDGARGPETPGGRKVTPAEALEIAGAVLATLVEPIAEILQDDHDK